MGKEDDKKKSKDKDKDKKSDKDEKKDKDKKDKDKKDKDKKDKDKSDKDKKDKDKSDKDKKDKDKKDDKDKDKKDKSKGDETWKLEASKNLDNQIALFESIANRFKDIDNYILKDATSKEDFIAKVKKSISDLPEGTQTVFNGFLSSI